MGFSLNSIFKRTLDPLNISGINDVDEAGAAQQAANLASLRERQEAASTEANIQYEADLTERQERNDPLANRVQEIQGDLGNRLSALRGDRDNLTAARSQPERQQLAEEAGLQRRSLEGEGSRQSAQRSGVNQQQALGNQQIEIQSLQEQIGQEAGVEQLQTEFTAFFNELAANRFSRELSGLGVEINEYLSERGAKIGYRELEAEARATTNDMYARFLSGLGSISGNDNTDPNVYGDDSYPAYDPARL